MLIRILFDMQASQSSEGDQELEDKKAASSSQPPRPSRKDASPGIKDLEILNCANAQNFLEVTKKFASQGSQLNFCSHCLSLVGFFIACCLAK